MASTATSPPPSSLPSPSVSNSHTGFSMSALSAPNGTPRAPSTASHVSNDGRDGRDSRAGAYPSGSSAGNFPQHPYRPHHDDTTPQPNLYQQPSYLPPVTTSPPPHAPTYIPPPQHAMAPDPIHGMMPGPAAVGPGFPNGAYPPQYRAGPGPYGQGYRLPNGHTPSIPGPEGFLPSRHPGGPGGPMANQALLQQAILMSNGSGRPGSASGSRERRPRERSHHRDDEGDRDSREEEVISTIFVVGFPDDMSEREFQNIFTFAPGFEAATLKFPSGSNRSREPTAALLAELTQLAASQQAAAAQQAAANGEPPEYPLQSPLEEAIAALQLSSTTSSSTTPSAAVSLTPSVPAGPFNQGLPQLPTRRQTIGFARFKTRADALAARENLQGKKIDPLTGATLKAEMAKKNLHTKRNNANDDLVGMLLRSGRLAGLVGHQPASQPLLPPPHAIGPPGIGGPAPYMPGRDNWDWQGAEEKYGHQTQSAAYPGSGPPLLVHPSQPPYTADAQASLQSNGSNTSASPPRSMTSPNGRPTDSKALLALAADADDLDEWSAIEGMTMSIEGLGNRSAEDTTPRHDRERSGNTGATYPITAPGPNPAIPISTSAPSGNSEAINVAAQTGSSSLPMNVHSPTLSNSNMYRPGYGTNSAGAMSPHASLDGFAGSPPAMAGEHMEGGRPVGGIGGASNPADQNPPINTLYVGNLPAISPPTHPPNFLEEALRSLFCRFPGYKRMSFRQKINGPMCFVEFEDVNYAAQAIKDLYGHTLAGIVKGGIRLSYSKNSLGQRGSAHPAGTNTSLFGGIAHTVALAGMSSPSSQNGNYPNGNGAGPHSAPIPMPNDVRRASEVSGLSPTAQPFNAPLPITQSPRSRFFGSSPSQNAPTISTAQPIPQAPSSQSGSFSPVSSPIRTPASFSWVSSGSAGIGGIGNGGVGNGGYGFEPFSPHSNGGGLSLSGAASAWQQGNGSRRTPT